jgi:hypothetical protein
MAETFGTVDGTKWLAGKGMSADLEADENAILIRFIEDAEATICARSRKDWIGEWENLDNGLKNILRETADSLAAAKAVAYDFDGYPSRITAEDTVNLNMWRANHNLKLLSDQNVVTKLMG